MNTEKQPHPGQFEQATSTTQPALPSPQPGAPGTPLTLRQFMAPVSTQSHPHPSPSQQPAPLAQPGAPGTPLTLRQFMAPVPLAPVPFSSSESQPAGPPRQTRSPASLPPPRASTPAGVGGQGLPVPASLSAPQTGAPPASWQQQVRGGTTSSSVPPRPAPPSGALNSAALALEEDFDDPFASADSVVLGLLAWPFRALGALFRPRRSLPALTQMAATECGAASLAMILCYYGHHLSISEVSSQCGVGRDGLSASTIVKSARQYGLNARAVSVNTPELFADFELPAIIHWQFNHFMVIERWTPKYVYVADPAVGRRKLSAEEFDLNFTGIAILLEPSEHFTRRRGASSSALLLEYVHNGLKLAPGGMLQILLASLILLLFGLLMPTTTALIVNSIVPLSLVNVVPVFALGMGMLILSQTVLSYLRAIILVKIQARIDTHLMVSFFDHLLSLPLRYFQLRSSGDIISRLQSNVVLREVLNTQLISSVLDTISVIVYLVILIKLAPVFALIAVGFGAAQVLLMLGATKRILTLLKSNLEAQGRSQGYFTEALMQITTLKAAGAEKHVRLRWLRLFFAEMSGEVKQSYLVSFIGSLQSIIRSAAPLVLMIIGAQQVISGSMALGTMLALQSLATSFLTPLESLVSTGHQIQQAQTHLERIVDVMKAEPEQHGKALIRPPRLAGHIQLANVGFQYDLNAKPILSNLNLTIEPGQKVAIVGRSGSGKSTLGKLLLGLYLPTQGEIYYDNTPLSSMNHQEVRAQFGVVMQDVGLFNGSIRENIAFNTPGIDITAVIWAAQAAAIHDDILKMPMDYETIVSEGGTGISGGQRQRMALARALVRNPAILLLDEATSSLDVVTERVVEQNLNALSCTQIIIAHRLSTIRNADLILAVDQGTIVEQGTHEELVQRHGFYAQLIESQMASGDIQQNR